MEIKEISLVEFLELLAKGSKPKAFIYEKQYYWLDESRNRYESQKDYFDYIEIKNLNNKIQVILKPTPCEIAQDKDLDDKEFDENNKSYDFEESN